jgi:hypothetical protein
LKSGSFQFPPHAAANANRAAQIALWKTGEPELRPFVSLLDTAFRPAGTVDFDVEPAFKLDVPARKVTPPAHLRSDYDLLLAGPCQSPAHARFVAGVAGRLADEGLSILYVGLSEEDIQQALGVLAPLEALGQVDVLDLRAYGDNSDAGPLQREALETWRRFGEICAANGLHLPVQEFAEVVELLLARLLWRRVLEHVRIRKSAVLRVWWQALGAELAWWAASQSLRPVSFQHSLVTCPSSFSPLPLDVLFCFGTPSARLIGSLNESFYASVGEPARALACVPAGAMYDNILHAQSGRRDILVLEELGGDWTREVFGSDKSRSGLVHVVGALASRLEPGVKIVLRCHPHAQTAAAWRELHQTHPDSFTFSAPGRSLDEDIRDCGVCIGLYSTVLPVAAASGLATFVLHEPGWYYTPDLASLGNCLLGRDETIKLVLRCTEDEGMLKKRQAVSQVAGQAYFYNASRWDLDHPPLVSAG